MNMDIFKGIDMAISRLEEADVKASDLDKLVINVAWRAAMNANNEGVHEQVSFLFQVLGTSAAEKISASTGVDIEIDEELKDVWAVDDERYPRSDWKYEVQNGDTNFGYHDWLIHKIESENG